MALESGYLQFVKTLFQLGDTSFWNDVTYPSGWQYRLMFFSIINRATSSAAWLNGTTIFV